MPSTSHTSKRRSVIIDEADLAVNIFTDLLSGKKSLLINTFEYTTSISKVYTANQANLVLLTPSAGRYICVHATYIATESNTGEVALDFLTSVTPVARLYAARQQQIAFQEIHLDGAVGEVLTLNTTTGNNDVFLVVNYCELE